MFFLVVAGAASVVISQIQLDKGPSDLLVQPSPFIPSSAPSFSVALQSGPTDVIDIVGCAVRHICDLLHPQLSRRLRSFDSGNFMCYQSLLFLVTLQIVTDVA